MTDHDVAAIESFRPARGPRLYRYVCSCGEKTKAYPKRERARREFMEHQRDQTREEEHDAEPDAGE